jgi:nucleotide-binding universal stress UspA family protein
MKNSHEFHRILVASDFSPPAEAALRQAIWIASVTGAKNEHVLGIVGERRRILERLGS